MPGRGTQEAARDLVRAREDVRGDLMSARHRLSKLLLRQGMSTTPGLGLAFDIAYDTPLAAVARRDRLDAAIAEMATASEFTPVVTRLGCLRGVSTLTAFGLAVEIGDWHRLDGHSIGAYHGGRKGRVTRGATVRGDGQEDPPRRRGRRDRR